MAEGMGRGSIERNRVQSVFVGDDRVSVTVNTRDCRERECLYRSDTKLSLKRLIENGSIDSRDREGQVDVKELTRKVIVHSWNSSVSDVPQCQVFEVGRASRSTRSVQSSVDVTIFAVYRRSDHVHEGRCDGASCGDRSGRSRYCH